LDSDQRDYKIVLWVNDVLVTDLERWKWLEAGVQVLVGFVELERAKF